MKIAVIELDTHSECLYSFCKIFAGSEHHLTIYTKMSIHNEITGESFMKQFDWQIKPQKLSKAKYLRQINDSLNTHDIIFISTVESCYRTYANLDYGALTVLRIHNANTWLNRWKSISISFSPYILYKDLSYFIRIAIYGLDWLHTKKLVERINFITLPNKTIQQYVEKHGLVDPEKIAPCFPLAVYDNSNTNDKNKDVVRITVPGAVDQRRRDYQLLLSAWKQIIPKLEKRVELSLLGKTKGGYGKRIVHAFQDLQSDKFKFRSYLNRLQQLEFNDVMRNSDLLVSPIILDTRYKIYREKYGFTKISGIETDVIRHGIPAIIPSGYPLDENLKQLIDGYDSVEGLSRLLLEYINGDLLDQRKSSVRQVTEFYKPVKVREKLIRFLKDNSRRLN